VAWDKKKTVNRHATLVFTDESGFMLLPLVHRTLAPKGRAAPLVHRARHRDRVSVAAAVTLSPARGHVGLYYKTYPNGYVNVEVYADFVRGLLRQIHNPLVLVHDRGNMHRGEPMRQLQRDFSAERLNLNLLPPYAPDLNPVEPLWNFAKDKQLSNFVPHDVRELDTAVRGCLDDVRHDQVRLRSFIRSVPQSWNLLTVFK
jgi:putative transposase